MLTLFAGAVFAFSCSYSAVFAFANNTGEDGRLFVRFRQRNGNCPSIRDLAVAPASQLQRRWFRDPSPNWELLASDAFVYSNLDCSIITSLKHGQAIAVARVSDLLLQNDEWDQEFLVDRLIFRSLSHLLELEGATVLEHFERRAEFLFVASISAPVT